MPNSKTTGQTLPAGEPARQVVANVANAKKSTGPKTADGKANSSRNALKHGFRAKDGAEPSGEEREFEEFRAKIVRHLLPSDPLQDSLADRIAACLWRLRRVRKFESEMLQAEFNRLDEIDLPFDKFKGPTTFLTLTRYERNIERSLYQALETFLVAHEAQEKEINAMFYRDTAFGTNELATANRNR